MLNIPFTFGLSFFYRIVIPGLIAGLTYALLRGNFGFVSNIEHLTIFLLESLLIGLGLRTISPFLLAFLYYGEGWPTWLRSKRIRSLDKQLRDAERIIDVPLSEFPSAKAFKHQKMQEFVLSFPFTDQGRFVVAPTRMGNMVGSLLSYLSILYSLPHLVGSLGYTRDMLSIFVRLWYALDREIRADVAEGVAFVEALAMSLLIAVAGAVAFLGKGLWEKVLLASILQARLSLVTSGTLFLLAILLYKALERETASVVVQLEALFGRDRTRGEIDAVVEDIRKSLRAKMPPKGDNKR